LKERTRAAEAEKVSMGPKSGKYELTELALCKFKLSIFGDAQSNELQI
jgi:hypothetical protein